MKATQMSYSKVNTRNTTTFPIFQKVLNKHKLIIYLEEVELYKNYETTRRVALN